MLDTQGVNPPHVRVRVNGEAFERSLPFGAGDEAAGLRVAQVDVAHLREGEQLAKFEPGSDLVAPVTVRRWLAAIFDYRARQIEVSLR